MKRIAGVREIGVLLGVSRARADELTKRAGFPAPAYYLSAGQIWDVDDVTEWARAQGRVRLDLEAYRDHCAANRAEVVAKRAPKRPPRRRTT